ncbi:ras association domain-containing protein 2 isoform X2 [Cebus imitator]|uniref:ras association domain-containing protein 2 isoform X2 n=1 Tax=Cebus imitator TaxID=2715852 RepID=UPI0018991284|nr:ras association domain-containing protein 2 isoform X2 [Cebus imitator]
MEKGEVRNGQRSLASLAFLSRLAGPLSRRGLFSPCPAETLLGISWVLEKKKIPQPLPEESRPQEVGLVGQRDCSLGVAVTAPGEPRSLGQVSIPLGEGSSKEVSGIPRLESVFRKSRGGVYAGWGYSKCLVSLMPRGCGSPAGLTGVEEGLKWWLSLERVVVLKRAGVLALEDGGIACSLPGYLERGLVQLGIPCVGEAARGRGTGQCLLHLAKWACACTCCISSQHHPHFPERGPLYPWHSTAHLSVSPHDFCLEGQVFSSACAILGVSWCGGQPQLFSVLWMLWPT